MTEREEKIVKIFKDNDLHHDWYFDANGRLCVQVECGDWKHDHIALRLILEEHGYEEIECRQFGEPTFDDTYSATHVFNPPGTHGVLT